MGRSIPKTMRASLSLGAIALQKRTLSPVTETIYLGNQEQIYTVRWTGGVCDGGILSRYRRIKFLFGVEV
jgi:hypothetical protein